MTADHPICCPDVSSPVPIRPRRLGAGFRSILATALAFGVFLAANALSMRLWARGEFAHHVRGAVSEEARSRLSGLSGHASVVAFFERSSPLRNPARRMLADLADAAAENPALALSVEAVDLNHDLPRVAALARRWPVEANSVVVESGGRFAVLSGDELCRPASHGGAPVFAGDVPCAEALVSLLSPGSGGSFLFMRGHDETESAGNDVSAFPLARLLEGAGHETADAGPWLAGIPRGAVAVCDAPRVPWSSAEAADAVAFLRNGGRMLLLAGPETAGAFGGFWTECGITPVPAPGGSGRIGGPGGTLPRVVRGETVPGHPVSDRAGGASLLFSDTVAFSVGSSRPRAADEPSAAPLAKPSRGVGRPDARGEDRALAVAVEWPGVSASGRTGRLVVVGDGAFATEAALRASPGNGRLLRAAADWLSAP